ncbi:MAG: TonB-dependent receptor plug domain-containing protein, partial [Flavobacteriales bacterium]
RTKPEKGFDSPELIYAFNIGNGSTVYQGDNRFRLDDIVFFQNRVEYRKQNKFFIRAYMTKEDAGNSYDPYATGLALIEDARDQNSWAQVYTKYWRDSIDSRIDDLGYPELEINPEPPFNGIFDYEALDEWNNTYYDSLVYYHSLVEQWTNNGSAGIAGIDDLGYYEPGSAEFQQNFNRLIRAKNNDEEAGTRFYDKSALYHVHGEYLFEPVKWVNEIRVGANGRMYRPDSDGTIFSDTSGTRITNTEWGAYLGVQKKFNENKWIVNVTGRIDKNENFDYVISPAASVVFTPKENNYLRFSFSSALRNPTLADQYLFLDVGPAILSGNLNGVDSLITVESFSDYLNTQDPDTVRYFNLDPIQPEQVRTLEVGYRTTLGEKLYVDAGYYFSQYTNFIGFNIGVVADFDTAGLIEDVQAYRYSANSKNEVLTQGFSIGLNYYLNEHFSLNGNYGWNQLVKSDEDDPIIPAFNTPENKFNLGLTARNMESSWGGGKNIWGFGVNYKWVEGFLFEGSPQFTGQVPSYDMVDAQVNYYIDAITTTFKVGASNLLDNRQFQTYGGPRIGRLAYFSILYEFNKNLK